MEAYAALAKLQRTAPKTRTSRCTWAGPRPRAHEWDKAQTRLHAGAGAGQGSLARAVWPGAGADGARRQGAREGVVPEGVRQGSRSAALRCVAGDRGARHGGARRHGTAREEARGRLCEKAPEAQTANPRDPFARVDALRRGGHGGPRATSKPPSAFAPPSSSTIATWTP